MRQPVAAAPAVFLTFSASLSFLVIFLAIFTAISQLGMKKVNQSIN